MPLTSCFRTHRTLTVSRFNLPRNHVEILFARLTSRRRRPRLERVSLNEISRARSPAKGSGHYDTLTVLFWEIRRCSWESVQGFFPTQNVEAETLFGAGEMGRPKSQTQMLETDIVFFQDRLQMVTTSIEFPSQETKITLSELFQPALTMP